MIRVIEAFMPTDIRQGHGGNIERTIKAIVTKEWRQQ